MSVTDSQRSVENLFNFQQPSRAGVEVDNALIFEEINRELEAYLPRESGSDQDSRDGVFDLLSSISDSVQDVLGELISGDDDKRRFLWALSRIFTLLLSTKVDTAQKIKRILKIALEATLKVWPGTKSLW